MKPTVSFAPLFFLLCCPLWATGFAEEEDPATLRNGLTAEYTDGIGLPVRRIDAQVSLALHAAAPDRRLSPEAFEISWQGYVLIPKAGEYRFPIWLDGQCSLEIAKEIVVAQITDELRWIDSRAISLDPGWQPFTLRFRKTNETAAIHLFWTGPGFELEPLGPRNLFHDPADDIDTHFERGANLVRALRCAACHQISGEPSPLAAPALDRLTETNIDTVWLVDWLAADLAHALKPPAAERNQNNRNCPSFNLTRNEATAVVAFLHAESSGQVQTEEGEPAGDAAAGERLFVSTGCFACHRVGELGSHDELGGGDLSDVGRKRPKAFFARWLDDPSSINRDHRMQIFSIRNAIA
jgi:mono/diheme cytochrome c family protein